MMILLYLTTLFIAPQLWVEPFVDWRTDFIVYPLWMVVAMLSTRHESYRFTIQDGFFLAMIAWIVVTTFVNGENARSTDILIDYLKWYVLFKLVSASIPTLDHLRRVSWMVVFFAVVLAIEGIQHQLSPDGIGWAGQPLGWIDIGALESGVRGRTQWIGIFDGPGVFCVVYTVALPFLMQHLNPGLGGMKRLVALALIGLIGIAILYNASRGGFLTTLGVVALYFAFRYKISIIKIAVIGGIVSVLFMLAPAHITSMTDDSKSARYRVDMWIEGVEMAQHNPVFGIGKGNFGSYTGKLIAHNSAIEIMGETGMIGLFFWVGLLYFSFKYLFQFLKENEDPAANSLVTAVLLSIAGYLISAMFVTLEYETFYFLLGLSAAVRFHLKDPPKLEFRDLVIIGFLSLGFFALVKTFVILYYA